jgi:hypothetical protein
VVHTCYKCPLNFFRGEERPALIKNLFMATVSDYRLLSKKGEAN